MIAGSAVATIVWSSAARNNPISMPASTIHFVCGDRMLA